MFRGREISAKEALELGLINGIFPIDDFENSCIAQKLKITDILINNAAVCPASFIKDTTEDEKILYTFFILLMLFMAAPFILNAEQKPLIPEEFERGGSGDHRYIII